MGSVEFEPQEGGGEGEGQDEEGEDDDDDEEEEEEQEEEESKKPQIRRMGVPPAGVKQLLHLAEKMLLPRRNVEGGVKVKPDPGGFAEKALPLLKSNRLALKETGKIIHNLSILKQKPVGKGVAPDPREPQTKNFRWGAFRFTLRKK